MATSPNSLDIPISPEFRRHSIFAILNIILFFVVYIVLVLGSVGIASVLIYLTILLFLVKVHWLTAMLVVGSFAFVGTLIYFLFKFINRTSTTDTSGFIEITKKEEPVFFEFIDSITNKVKTKSPKHVYLSPGVNASVFYDSSFWSMFFPVKKNLQIGVGLINGVNQSELKAVLGHEFGHFSQRSMAIGSYVYNVNQIIYNLVYENEDMDAKIEKLSDTHWSIAIFFHLAVIVIKLIQKMLKIMYGVVNKSYMGLSRQMEFHADAVGAKITSPNSLSSALLRLDLLNFCYDEVINFMNTKISENYKSNNLYAKHSFLVRFYAERNKIDYRNGIANVEPDHQSKLYPSRLVLKDQWASHPSLDDRIKSLSNLNSNLKNDDEGNGTDAAFHLFSNPKQLQEKMTSFLFKEINFESDPLELNEATFQTEYSLSINNNSFPNVYNGYYNQWSPSPFDIETEKKIPSKFKTISELYDDKYVQNVREYRALQDDENTLIYLDEKTSGINTFDYEGTKYKLKDKEIVLSNMKTKKEELENTIKHHDKEVYRYFWGLAKSKDNSEQLNHFYDRYFKVDGCFDEFMNFISEFESVSSFMNVSTTIEEIPSLMDKMKEVEKEFKIKLHWLLGSDLFQTEVSIEHKEELSDFVNSDLTYFQYNEYIDEATTKLFFAKRTFREILFGAFYLRKKELLEYQSRLVT
ncbi:M48 family metallopeptidase [Leptospira sp. 96542]|nr:M48 family metallopeptidase [Leptospira sp. 96542]